MANTVIQILRSYANTRPTSLVDGELAYSFVSNTLFIGSQYGQIVDIGGQFYTSQIDNATNQATPSTIVKRDATGNAAFNFITANIIGTIIGNANSATQLLNPRNFSIDGTDITAPAVPFDGTGNVVLIASLDTVPGLNSGTYGSTTAIPVVTVGANGRVLAISTSTISTQFDIQGDTGTTTVEGGEILRLLGGDGISSDATTNTVTFNIDSSTVIRANTPSAIQTIDGNVEISGNLSVLGTEFITNTTTLNIADPLIYLASNNYVSDIVDIGFVGNYNDGANNRHTGVIRHAGNKEFYIFDNLLTEPTNSTVDIADPSFRAANVHMGRVIATEVDTSIFKSNGTESFAFTTNGFTSTLNNNGTATIYGDITASGINLNSYIQNAYNRANASVTSTTTLNNGQLIIGAGSNNVTTLANTTYTQTGTLTSNNTITSISVDPYGRFTAATVGAIGGLTVGQGGTGRNTFATNGIIYGNSTGGMLATTVAGASDQTWSNQILTVNDSGVPIWSDSLDGGVF